MWVGLSLCLWILGLVVVALLLFFTIFTLVSLTDLEHGDEPIETTRKLNYFIKREYLIHGTFSLILLFTGNWLEFLFNLPLLAWHFYRFRNKKYLFDEITIFRVLPDAQKIGFIKLAFYMLLFFFFLYRFVSTLVSILADDPSY